MIIPIAIVIFSALCYYLAYSYALPLLLWIGVIVSFALAVVGVLRNRVRTQRLLVLISFTISMRLPSFFQTRNWGFIYPFVDSSFDLTLSNLILESGRWQTGMGFEVIKGYSYYPVLHIWTVVTSEIMGIDPVLLARIFPFLVAPLVIVFFFLGLRKIVSEEVAIWSSLIYSLNSSLFFWEYYIREFMSLIFFSMCLYVIFHMYKSREARSRFFLLGTIAVFMTVASHHWTSYNLSLTLVVLAVLPPLYARAHTWVTNARLHHEHLKVPSHENLVKPLFLAFTLIVTFAWALYIAYNIFSIQAHQFLSFFINVTTPSSGFVVHSGGGGGFQTKFLLFFGYLVLGLLGFSELIRGFFNRQKSWDDYILEAWFLFCGIYIFVSTFLLPSGSEWWVLSWRSWVFAFFGLAPLAAKAIVRMYHWRGFSKFPSGLSVLTKARYLAPFVLIFTLISALLMAPPEIAQPSYPRTGDGFYSTANWARFHLQGEGIVLDPWAHSVITPYGRSPEMQFLRWPGGPAFFLDVVYKPDNSSSIPSSWRVVVFNRRISEWESTLSANSSKLDQDYNKIYDSHSLTVYVSTQPPNQNG